MVTVAKLKDIRSYVIVGAFVVAAVVTPPDVVSQLLLAIPMCLLYEFGILLAQVIEHFFAKRAAGDAGAAGQVVPAAANVEVRAGEAEAEQKLLK